MAHWLLEQDLLLGAKANRILALDLRKSAINKEKVVCSGPSNIFSHNRLLSRAGRKGFHYFMKPGNRDEIIGVWNNKIFVWKESFELSSLNFRGSRPLNICYNEAENCYYFGEYFSNENREKVYIFKSSDGLEWEKAYTFSAGSIRHVHRIEYDARHKAMWILTGDTDEESAIYITRDGFKNLEKVFYGSQKARAVGIIADEQILTIPSDTPLETNAIREFNMKTKEIKDIYPLPNSAFHAGTFGGDWQYVSTVAEPSEFNNQSEAFIFIRKKGDRWVELLSGKQDFFSSLSKRFFRYPEFIPCGNLQNSEGLIFSCRGINRLNNSSIIFEMEDIINFYNAIK